MKIYVIFDKAANIYGNMIALPNDEVAIRLFKSMVNGNQGNITEYPEDFSLHCIGTFDENIGYISPLVTKNGEKYVGHVINAVDCISK